MLFHLSDNVLSFRKQDTKVSTFVNGWRVERPANEDELRYLYFAAVSQSFRKNDFGCQRIVISKILCWVVFCFNHRLWTVPCLWYAVTSTWPHEKAFAQRFILKNDIITLWRSTIQLDFLIISYITLFHISIIW